MKTMEMRENGNGAAAADGLAEKAEYIRGRRGRRSAWSGCVMARIMTRDGRGRPVPAYCIRPAWCAEDLSARHPAYRLCDCMEKDSAVGRRTACRYTDCMKARCPYCRGVYRGFGGFGGYAVMRNVSDIVRLYDGHGQRDYWPDIMIGRSTGGGRWRRAVRPR